MKVSGFKDTIKWYDQNAKKYADATQDRGSLDDITDFSALLPNRARVLDAGCGAGRDTELLTDKGFRTTGIDLSHGLIEEARRRFPNCEFQEGSFLNLPFFDGEFDGIWSHASLVHLETIDDVRKALLEFQRVLKKEGILYLLVKAQTGVEKTAVVSDKLSGHDRFFQYFSLNELKELLHQAGFSVTQITQYKETDKNPDGRPEVEWVVSLSRKK